MLETVDLMQQNTCCKQIFVFSGYYTFSFLNPQVVIHTVRLPKQSTVGDVINDLKTKVIYSVSIYILLNDKKLHFRLKVLLLKRGPNWACFFLFFFSFLKNLF